MVVLSRFSVTCYGVGKRSQYKKRNVTLTLSVYLELKSCVGDKESTKERDLEDIVKRTCREMVF